MELRVFSKGFSQIRTIRGLGVYPYKPRYSRKCWSLNIFNNNPHLIIRYVVIDVRIIYFVHRLGVPEKKTNI